MFLTSGQRSDYIGARALLDSLPRAEHMLADRGYDADWYRDALENRGITPFIPSRKGRKVPIPHDEVRYRKRHKIENSFARLKDWRRVATRYDPLSAMHRIACRQWMPKGVPIRMRAGRSRHVMVMNPDSRARDFFCSMFMQKDNISYIKC